MNACGETGKLGHSVGNGFGVSSTARISEKTLLCGAGRGYCNFGKDVGVRGGVVINPSAEEGRSSTGESGKVG